MAEAFSKHGDTIWDAFVAGKELPEMITPAEELFKRGPLSTGILRLDYFMLGGLHRGITLVHGGYYDEGKSALAADLVVRQARQGNPVLYLPSDSILTNRIKDKLDTGEQNNVLLLGWSYVGEGKKKAMTFEVLTERIKTWSSEIDKIDKNQPRLVVIDAINPLITEMQSEFRGQGDLDRGYKLPKFVGDIYNLACESNVFIVITAQDRFAYDRRKDVYMQTPSTGEQLLRLSGFILKVDGSYLVRPGDLRDLDIPIVEKRQLRKVLKEKQMALMLRLRREKPKPADKKERFPSKVLDLCIF